PANEWWDCRPARRDRFWEAAAPPAKTASEATRRATAGPPPEPPPQGSVGIARRRGGKRIGRDEGAGIRFEASSCPILPGCAHHSVLSIGSFSRQSGGRWRRRRRKGGGHTRRWSRPPPPPAKGWSPSPALAGGGWRRRRGRPGDDGAPRSPSAPSPARAGEGGAEGDGRGRPFAPVVAAAPSTSQRLVPSPLSQGRTAAALARQVSRLNL